MQMRLCRCPTIIILLCTSVDFVLITAICKHFIRVKAVGLHWCDGLIVATPMVRKRFSSLRAQFLWFHTKHSMGVLIDFVELGIIF
jgi:hypothetical protein